MTENKRGPQVAVDVWLSDKKEPKEKKPVSAAQADILKRWIAEGAGHRRRGRGGDDPRRSADRHGPRRPGEPLR
ncbi:MAG: hypothetical protein EBW68_04650, partial [Actinobacteria bacterium]|nr:hypothetical protein [Actinomycetota bacterium]